MSSLLKEDSQDNVGSLVEINFIDVKDIDTIPDPIGINLYDPVILKSGKTWSNIEVCQETPGFDEETNYSQSGTGLNVSVKGFISGHNDVLESRLKSMLTKKFVVVVSDFEGRKRIIGTLKNPLRFKWSFTTGTRTNARKGYDLQFFHTTAKSPLFYQSALASVDMDTFDPNADSYLAALEARVSDLEDEIVTKQDSLGFTPENVANKNQPGGYPGLDGSELLLVAQMQAIIADGTSTATDHTWSIDKIKSSILALINDTLSSGSSNTWSINKINTAISTAINNVLNGAGPAYDTLKELQDLIVNDETTASALATTVAGKLAKASNLSDLNNSLTALQNLGAAYSLDVSKNGDFTVFATDRGKVFEITTGTSVITATLDGGCLVNGFMCLFRKYDSGTGSFVTNPSTQKLGKQGHTILLWSDGTSFYTRAFYGSFDSSGSLTISSMGDINLNPSGSVKINGSDLSSIIGSSSNDLFNYYNFK